MGSGGFLEIGDYDQKSQEVCPVCSPPTVGCMSIKSNSLLSACAWGCLDPDES